VNLLASLFLIAGALLLVSGTIGFLRLPDFFTRMHAISKNDTLGALLSVIGLALLVDDLLVALKLVLIALFMFIANPTATHALARAAVLVGMKPWTRKDAP
jgi:multicomponent Na+:H+ antiporter subunit G